MDMSKLVKRKEKETRTTCKLTEIGNSALESLMNFFDLNQKTIFKAILDDKEFSESILNASKQDVYDPSDYNVRKTMVIADDDLRSLNGAVRISMQDSVNRNVFIDRGIRMLAELMSEHRNITFAHYKTALDSSKSLLKEMERVDDELSQSVNEKDHYLSEFHSVLVSLEKFVDRLEREIIVENLLKAKQES